MLGAEQSGFIADLGYETYQKILNEAVHELKDEEFADLYADERAESTSSNVFVTDCQIDSDLEVLFSVAYIENVSERISLYRELDNIDNDAELLEFEKRLEDRFGKIPSEGLSLILVVRLRWLAMRLGIEKLVLKNETMTAFLVSNPQSPYYHSVPFGNLLQYMTSHPRKCRLREKNMRRSVVFSEVKTVETAFEILNSVER
jgi:transcription-repair coupling factor (superfamily II helicase)